MPLALIASLILLILATLSLFVGVIDLSPWAIFSDPESTWLLLVSRLPRTIAVILTGSSLAVSGLIMQMLVRNKFVEPATAGTGQSAALGIVLVTLFFPGASIMTKMLVSTVTALIGTAMFLTIIRRVPANQPLMIPLIGLVYGGVVGAAVTFVAYQYDLLQYLEVWLNGEFSGVLRGRYELLWLSGVLTIVAYFIADQFTILGMGRDMSLNLGLNYKYIMRLGLIIVSIVTALSVVTVGMIPFVGLVVPNLVSRMIGDNLRASLPWVAWFGAVMVMICDLIGRVIRFPYEIPVGTVFGVVGAVIFLWLLYGRPRHAH